MCKINQRPQVPWTKLLHKVVEEYSNSTHNVTKYAPRYLMYGLFSYPRAVQSATKTVEKAEKEAVENSLKYYSQNKIHYHKCFVPG